MRNFAKTSIFANKEQVASKYGSYEGVLVKFFLIYLSLFIVHKMPFRCMDSIILTRWDSRGTHLSYFGCFHIHINTLHPVQHHFAFASIVYPTRRKLEILSS